MLHRSLLSLALIALVSTVSSGCWATFHDAKFNAPDGASGYETLIVPLSDSKNNFWYGESRHGLEVIEALKYWARESSADAYFAEGPAAEEVLDKVYDWHGPKISSPQWKTLVKPIGGVKYVVVGDLTKFQLESRRTIGMWDCEATASIRVIDAETGKIVHENKDLVATVGKGDETHFTTTTVFDSRDKVRRALVANLGRRLGEELYGYYED